MWTVAALAFNPPGLHRRAWLGQAGAAGLALTPLPRLARATESLCVGVSLPLSGELAALGRTVLAGLQAGLAGAHVHGQALELLILDDAGRDAQALKNAQTLATDARVLALLGGLGPTTPLAMLPALDAGRLSLLGPMTGSESLRSISSPWVFPVRAGLQEEAARIVNQLDHQGLNDMAVVSGTDTWSREAEGAVQLEMNRAIMRPVARQTLAPDLSNLEPVIHAVVAGQPHAVIVAAPLRQAAPFIRRWNARGFRANVVVFSETGLGLHALLGDTARGVAVCQVMPSPWRTARSLVRDYQAALRDTAAPALQPLAQRYSYASLEGYVNAMILLQALQQTRSISRHTVAATLQTNSFALDGLLLKFGPPPRRGGRFCEMTLIGSDGVMRS